ncbi:MAG: LLM class flavin-dependent oxidoreductase [Rhodobacter sp.]|nr:LLM class flavin-dependent oxidoreductase [Rhodobacter sp.]
MGFSCFLQGSDTLTVQCGAMMLAAGHEIRAVITADAQVADWAGSEGLTVAETGAAVSGTADWLLSIANTQLISEAVLAKATQGAVNFHDGPLPRYAGLNAPVWAILGGEIRHGITWHVIEGGIDEGRIIAQQEIALAPDETALTLNAKCFSAAIERFGDVIAALEAGLPDTVPQDLSQRSYFGLHDRPVAGAAIDPARPAEEIARLVRALDHGDYRNPLSVPKLVLGDRVLLVTNADLVPGDGPAGTVLAADMESLTLACGTGAVKLSGLKDGMGAPAHAGLAPGSLLPGVDPAAIDAALKEAVRGEAAWARRFETYRPALWCETDGGTGACQYSLTGARDDLATAFAISVAALAGFAAVDLAQQVPDAVHGAHLPWRPVRFDPDLPLAQARAAYLGALADEASPVPADLPARVPGLSQRRGPEAALTEHGPLPGAALTLALADGVLHADLARIPRRLADLIAARIDHLAGLLEASDGTAAIADLPLMPEAERALVMETWNATGADYEAACIHRLFEAQAARMPEATALVYRGESLTYAELDARANRVAHVLRAMGVGPNQPVGLHVRRSSALLIGALGILKAGGAYLPLDPGYPADRIRLYIEDSGTRVILSETALGLAPGTGAEVLALDADPRLAEAPETAPDSPVSADDLAYMIYTSGSTGRPKGVMIEHRNVANFFTGMDDRIAHEDGSVLMAVTSLSFDISVLELFWTLARGFKVVLSDEDKLAAGAEAPASGQGMAFSLYYWGNDDGVGRDKYTMLLEGAKFADSHGFTAIWTPERHFHAFGGLYPNPSVTGAAVAAVTENLGVRAGSCVAPLHHPARIAEEWAVIDNLTGGRAGIAFASGWQPDDFVLRPENAPPNNKPALFEALADVRKLWAGESVDFTKADGSTIACLTQPRPVSKRLNAWVTTAGNPETWRQAGENGCHVLTHLLGQSVDEVGEKIGLYHAALRAAGHDPAEFTVTLLLHTFIAETRDSARAIAREPMKDYLRSAADLIKQYAWAFPAFKKPDGASSARELDLGSLEKDELEAILDFAFERYFERSGLFGTVEDALARVDEVRAIGVTEIACLIDYGIDRQTVLDGLVPLAEVVARANAGAEAEDHSLAASIRRHGVTHLQCTPYMARMLVTNEVSRDALAGIDHLMIGGEPLSPGLVADLARATDARIENMYGPTETTIWSTTAPARAGQPVRIGRPVANTRIYILNKAMAPVPVGVAGEMYIAGDGVARGYHGQPDLTAERFLDDPFQPGARMFRTGDLARWQANGQLEFLGRDDAQVKVRGYRIEIGEIEAALEAEPGVVQAVVTLATDASGTGQLTGYVTGSAGEAVLKQALAARLPAFMVPNRIVSLEAFPLTPNKKIDRKALPAPGAGRARPVSKPAPVPAPTTEAAAGAVAPDEAGEVIAEIWSEHLNLAHIAASDNFFDLGGHSLLAVEVHRAVRDRLGLKRLSIADIFRAPTLAGFTAHVEALMGAGGPEAPPPAAGGNPAAEQITDRRQALRQQRRRLH